MKKGIRRRPGGHGPNVVADVAARPIPIDQAALLRQLRRLSHLRYVLRRSGYRAGRDAVDGVHSQAGAQWSQARFEFAGSLFGLLLSGIIRLPGAKAQKRNEEAAWEYKVAPFSYNPGERLTDERYSSDG